MHIVERLPHRLKQRVKSELVKRYYGNSVDYAVNVEGMRRIKNAQRSFTELVDRQLRSEYRRKMVSTLPGYHFDPTAFASVQRSAVAALDDPERSPCCYNSGHQAEAQGIPREV